MKVTILATIVGVLAILANGQGAAVGEERANLGVAVKSFYKELQRIMPCGYAAWNLPVLAPFTVKEYALNFENDDLKINELVSNFLLSGLNKFYVLDSTYNASEKHMSFDIVFTDLHVFGEYVLDAWANIAGYPLDIKADGVLDSKVVDYRIVGDFTFGQSDLNENGLSIADFNLNLYLGDIVVNNWNKQWNIAANNFVNNWSEKFVSMYIQQIQPQLNEIFREFALPTINSWLSEITVDDIVDTLSNATKDLEAVDCHA